MHTNSGKKVFHAIMRCHCISEHSSLSKAVRFHECGTLRYAQVPSGALRYAQIPSETLCFNIGPTVLRATDTLHCFNGLQQPQRPSRPQAPEEPQRPQGWMPSFDFRLPIPQLSEKNPKKLRKNFANRNYCVSLELGRVVRERP